MTLTACASAGKPSPDAAPPQVALEQTVTRLVVCPAELTLDVPPRAMPAAGAVLRVNPAADDYLDAKDAREDLLAARLADAKAECERQKGRP